MSREFADALDRLLEAPCAPARLRAYEAGESPAALWEEIAGAGFLDALVSEDAGGAGLGLTDVAELLVMLGRRLPPLPIAQTTVARALIDTRAAAAHGPIVLATPRRSDRGGWIAPMVPFARIGEGALLQLDDRLVLTPLASTEVRPAADPRSLSADLRWAGEPEAIATAPAPSTPLLAVAAGLAAVEMAGAMEVVCEMTLAYAATRRQFGRAIGGFQAVQHQIAAMAEAAVAARMAAALVCAVNGPLPTLLAAAVAKLRASVAAAEVSAVAHAVHGAIGISEEYDLQLYTRRLGEWRVAHGTEGHWAKVVGDARLRNGGSTVDFARELTGE